jgi:hypothetical protein
MHENIILDITDYSGLRVVLLEKRWDEHIKCRHPEMLSCLRQVEDVLRDPGFVYHVGDFAKTRLYYRLGAIDRFCHLYLVAVVRCDLQPAQVSTAYLTAEPSRSAGRLVYVKAHR